MSGEWEAMEKVSGNGRAGMCRSPLNALTLHFRAPVFWGFSSEITSCTGDLWNWEVTPRVAASVCLSLQISPLKILPLPHLPPARASPQSPFSLPAQVRSTWMGDPQLRRGTLHRKLSVCSAEWASPGCIHSLSKQPLHPFLCLRHPHPKLFLIIPSLSSCRLPNPFYSLPQVTLDPSFPLYSHGSS